MDKPPEDGDGPGGMPNPMEKEEVGRDNGPPAVEEHGNSFKRYMDAKNLKLRYQFDRERKKRRTEMAEEGGTSSSELFKGVCIHVNGFTQPSHGELKDIMAEFGGSFEHYYSASRVTHIVCNNLPDGKIKQYLKERNPVPVVHTDWVVESVKAGRLLPIADFVLERLQNKQAKLSAAFKSTSKESPGDANDGGECDKEKVLSDFVDSYFKSSRLHFIGSWKASVEALMSSSLSNRSSNLAPQPRHSNDLEARRIIHVDIDCFFASVAILEDPSLRDKPVAVCHSDAAKGTAEISSANYKARSFGVKAGMFIAKAKTLCPDLVRAPYHFEKYQSISNHLYRILLEYSTSVQPLSIDEALIDVTGLGDAWGIAEEIRTKFYHACGITVSAGISHNILLAKIATKKAKPNGKFFIPVAGAGAFLKDARVSDLPGVGYHMSKRLADNDVETCEDVCRMTQHKLQQMLGNKTGEMLWEYAHARDKRPVKLVGGRQSIGAEINWGIRFTSDSEATYVLTKIGREVTRRMEDGSARGRTITLKLKKRKPDAPEPRKYLGHGYCDNISKSVTLSSATCDSERIAKEAVQLYHTLQVPPSEIRGLGIQVSRLTDESSETAGKGQQLRGTGVLFGQGKPQSSTQPRGASGLEAKDPEGNGSKGSAPKGLPMPGPNQKDIKLAKGFSSRECSSLHPGEVDMAVLAELPAEIREELRLAFGISPKKRLPPVGSADRSQIKLGHRVARAQGRASTSGDMLSLSQVDEAVLGELPGEIQQEIKDLLPQSRVRTVTKQQGEKEPRCRRSLNDDSDCQANPSVTQDTYSSMKSRLDQATSVAGLKGVMEEILAESDSEIGQGGCYKALWEMLNTYAEDNVPFNLEQVQRLLRGLGRFGVAWLSARGLDLPLFLSRIQSRIQDVHGGTLNLQA